MKRKLITLLIIWLTISSSFANDGVLKLIQLDKKYKVENTFSGNLDEKTSFHLIFSKNKENKQYTTHAYIFDGENKVKLPNFINQKEASVLSFHKQNDILSVLYGFKGEKKKNFLKRVDYNLKNKEVTQSKSFLNDDLLTTVRLKDKSIAIYKLDKKLIIKEFEGNLPITSKEYPFKNKEDKVKEFLKDQSVNTIKTDEFVANGSTNKVRLYYDNNTLFFTKDSDDPFDVNIAGVSLNNKKTNSTQILKFDLNEEKLQANFSTFKNLEGEKFKKATSYFSNGKLFQLALSKNKGFVNITDLKSGKKLNNISLDENLAKYIKGNNNFQGIENFLKNAGKNKYNATITVNTTKSTKLRVRIDYVNQEYSYNYNWWWYHQQFMMLQQQQIMEKVRASIPSGFGPRQPNEDAFENATIKKEKRFFELLIDFNGKLSTESLPETIYKEIDKKEYIDKLKEIKDIKNQSSCFLKDSFRYIGYSKKLKGFVIQTNKIE